MKELVTQSYPTLSEPTDCSLPGSSLHGILQARILEWIAKINMIVTWLKFQFSHPDKDQIKLMRQLGIHRPKSRRRIIVRGPKNGRSPGSFEITLLILSQICSVRALLSIGSSDFLFEFLLEYS